MNKFSKILENKENKKYWKISTEVDLIIHAESEGEAGYLADSELGAIKTHSDFRILNIEEITDDEYQELKIIESKKNNNK